MLHRMLTPKVLQLLLLLVVAIYGSFLLIVYVDGLGILNLSSPPAPQLLQLRSTSLPLGIHLQHGRSLPLRIESLKPALYLQSEEGVKINILADITIMIKTMDRSTCVRKLIMDIHAQHPNLTILVADDGELPSWTEVDSIPFIKYYRMPYDSGLSAGRNLMLSQVQTPYVLLLEDDFQWDTSVLQDFVHVMQLHPFLDIVGGYAGLHFAGFLKVLNSTLFLVKGEYGVLEGTDKLHASNGRLCEVVDFVPNFFLAKTETLINLQWNNELKIGEHSDFFMRFYEGHYKAAFCPGISIVNQQGKCAEVHGNAAEHKIASKGRARMFVKQGLKIHNLKKIAYCLGENIGGTAWERIYDLPDHACYEVPLPEDCPAGWDGENCDVCMPNHFGPYCKPCECLHGTCKLHQETGVYCVCEIGWTGADCSKMIPFSPDLIQDPTFASLDDSYSERWREFKDGCISLAPEGLWLINDGSLECGTVLQLKLNQKEATAIKVHGESMTVGMKPIDNPTSYCLYVEILFTDKSKPDDVFLSFSPSAKLQSRELIINPEKPVESVLVYVVLRKVFGSAFFQNVTVQTQIT